MIGQHHVGKPTRHASVRDIQQLRHFCLQLHYLDGGWLCLDIKDQKMPERIRGKTHEPLKGHDVVEERLRATLEFIKHSG